ncbi:hypothetical protein QTP88_014887 [Uroleucon formosanum]
MAVNETQNGQINNDIIGRDFGSASTNMSSDFSYFKKPKSLALGEFFDFHPYQPHLTHPFKSSKVFLGKNNIQRRWLTYDEHSEKLFCSVCLAFSSERNIFIDGFNTWSHVYQRVQEHEIIKSHNLSSEAFLNYLSKKTIYYRLFSEQLHKKKIEVTKNQNILQRVIDVIKLIGKISLSYRGHRNEGADNILLLLKKYDVVLSEHIDLITKNASVNHKKGKGKGRGASLTFISKTTVNMVIDSISYLMKKSISDEIRDAVMFSVQLDTTQDISVQDQCSIILRYVNYKGIQERLLAVITVQQSTGKSFSDMLQGVLADNAANMQGQFNGFSVWLEKSTPNQVHVWCYSHILNLVIIDSTKSPLKAAALFVTLNDLANYFKESYKRMNVWVNFVGENNKKRLQSIGNTRWWSKEVALKHIFGSDGMYIDVILVLNSIENSNGFTPEARLKAKTLKNSILDYSTILTAFIYIRIFNIVGPLSKYLQSKGMDLLKFQEMVLMAKRFIDTMSEKLESLETENIDIVIETELPINRSRKRKILSGEKNNDEPIIDPEIKFTVEFSKNQILYTDFACLSPVNFEDINKRNFPPNALVELTNKIKRFDETITRDSLQNELLSFASNWNELKKSVPESYEVATFNEIQDEEDVENKTMNKSHCKSCMNCSICCYLVLQKYNLYSNAYSHLTMAYKYLLTSPCTQVACEKSFSILKYLKNRLRSTLNESKLETFMIMSIEKDTLFKINTDEVIDQLKTKSNLLSRELSY